MTATPRIVRTIALPSAPRLRRVAGVNTRPLGKISLFLAATCILGATALCYVWQTSKAYETSYQIRRLALQLDTAKNTEADLEDQVGKLQTYSVVYTSARTYGMVPVDPSTEHIIPVPGPVTTTYVVSNGTGAPRATATGVHLSTTNATMTSWWQGLWAALYHVMH